MSDFANNRNNSVPIKVDRVFDSCSDKDCVTGVRVNLTCPLPECTTVVKSKCITVSDVCMTVEPIPFNKGFYSVDITFTFDVELAAYEQACGTPTTVYGTASVSKNCILYGSETNSKTFSSDGSVIGKTGSCCNTINPPKAIVQVVSPLVLDAKIASCNICDYICGCGCGSMNDGELLGINRPSRTVVLTIGLFYVVELVRPVTVMVQTSPYTIPQKECCSETDSPCEIFEKINFPIEEFSPQVAGSKEHSCGCGCGCGHRSNLSLNPPAIDDDDIEDFNCGCSK